MKIITILGARPQFIKASSINKELRKHSELEEIIIHTGQHFDEKMSDVFFNQMEISVPNYNLGINSLNHGAMTGRMMEKIENIILQEKPQVVLVYGDTNSTLAGAIAAKKLHVKLAHVEAGLRSFNMHMPEEINRILTDRISDILFTPTQVAIDNLKSEGFSNSSSKIVLSGDVMHDATLKFLPQAKKPNVEIPDKFILATVHRQENTDKTESLLSIFSGLSEISREIPIVIPIHPRTKKIIEKLKLNPPKTIQLIEPVGYLEMLFLLSNCSLVMTDSGGLQKEAYFHKKKCITLRNETEWIELVENRYNILAGNEKENIISAYDSFNDTNVSFDKYLYGQGNASEIIVNELLKYT